MTTPSENPDSSELMQENIREGLYFHWGGHVIAFSGGVLDVYLTDNHLITAGAILPFIGYFLLVALIDIIRVCRHYGEERRIIPLYMAKFCLYLLFSGVLIIG